MKIRKTFAPVLIVLLLISGYFVLQNYSIIPSGSDIKVVSQSNAFNEPNHDGFNTILKLQNEGLNISPGFIIELEAIPIDSYSGFDIGTLNVCNDDNYDAHYSVSSMTSGQNIIFSIATPKLPTGSYYFRLVSVESCCSEGDCIAFGPFSNGKVYGPFGITSDLTTTTTTTSTTILMDTSTTISITTTTTTADKNNFDDTTPGTSFSFLDFIKQNKYYFVFGAIGILMLIILVGGKKK